MSFNPVGLIFFLIVIVLLTLCYTALMLYLRAGVAKISTDQGCAFQGPVSVIVPCFNDAQQLRYLVEDLKSQEGNGLQFEVLIVNDHSSEEETERLETMALQWPENFKLYHNPLGAGKKKAIAYAVDLTQYNIIIQTDADCRVNHNFISRISAPFAEEKVQLVLGMVEMTATRSLWSRLARLDFMSLQLSGLACAAMGRAFMGNGAAMAYRKTCWQRYAEVGQSWQSGDDVFLIQAVQKYSAHGIALAPRAKISTAAPERLRAFISQRIRWGAKTGAYLTTFPKALAAIVTLANWAFVLLLFAAFFWPPAAVVFFLWAVLKLSLELLLLRYFARRLNLSLPPKDFLLALLYPFYIASTTFLILIAGNHINWKGRSLKRPNL